MSRPSRAELETAVERMRILLGSVDRVTARDEEKLRRRARSAVDRVAKTSGLSSYNAWVQVEAEARRRGGKLAVPGKDI